MIDKSLTLTGEDKEDTIIEGAGDGAVILSNDVDLVSVTNFMIRNNNVDEGFSTLGQDAEEQLTISNNIFCDCSNYAIDLWATCSSVISNNEIYNCDEGIHIKFHSNFNVFKQNFIDDFSPYEYSAGFKIDTSDNNIISNNTIYSAYMGICMSAPGRASCNNTIAFNEIYDSYCGIRIQYGVDNRFLGNVLQGNDYGSFVSESSRNIFYQNDYIDNNLHVIENDPFLEVGQNFWYESSLEMGNFYDDYAGSDDDGDGIGDSPYEVDGNAGSNDLYPLMIPFNDINFPPSDPNVYGPSSGKIEEEYSYSVCSSDFNDDELYYLINWGDGISTGWKGPFPSGTEQTFSHTWFKQGDFTIRVQCKDEDGLLSDWTNLPVTMPKRKEVSLGVFYLLLNLLENNLLENFPFLHFMGTVFSV